MLGVELPRLERDEHGFHLLVDGRPFLILGLQWGCDSCFSVEEMTPLFAEAARMGANTAALPIYWREVEPQPGVYDFSMLDERLRGARAAGLRIILLWFATWKNASPFYAPADIRADDSRFPRARDSLGRPVISHCPSGENTLRRDGDALVAVLDHLRVCDAQRSVILLQIENEPGLLGTDRCYCAACTARFQRESWSERHGARAAEAFSADAIGRYIDHLAERARQTYPLPIYVNVWLGGGPGSYPGVQYPAGGAVAGVLEIFRQAAPHVDFIAPDIYQHGYREFQQLCQTYGQDQPLYVAEHSSSAEGRAERNVFYALGEHAALGFDPWAIDEPVPRTPGATPLVDPTDRRWAPHAFALRDSYEAIGRALEPIAAAQGTDRLFAVVQEPGASGAGWSRPGCDVVVSYGAAADGAARGLLIEMARREFLLIGLGFGVRFCDPATGAAIAMVACDFGRFDGQRWTTLHPMRREADEAVGRPIYLRRPGVVRVTLGD